MNIVKALGRTGLVLGLRQGRQQHGSEDCDYRDYHQQFDQRESRRVGFSEWCLD
jgi:hypothetical protein